MDKKFSFIYGALVLAISTIMIRSVNNMVITTVPLLGRYVLVLSNVEISFIIATVYISMMLVTFYVNPALTSTVRRRAFIASNFVISIALVGYYFSSTLSLFILSAAAGIAFGLMIPNLTTAASLVGGQEHLERVMALYTVSLSISLVLGPAYETFLLKFVSYREVFLLFLPFSVTGFIASFFLKFPATRKENYGMKTFKNRGLIASILLITTYNIPFAIISIYLVIFSISKFGISGDLGYSLFIPFFTVSFLTRIYMMIRPFKNHLYPAIASIAITMIGIVLIFLSTNFVYLYIVMAMLGIPHGLVFTLSVITISKNTGIEERNAANSYFMAYNNVLFLASPVLFSVIAVYITMNTTFLLVLIPVVISAVLLRKYYDVIK
ncbi:MAG: MFS transporter [Thermoplasmata archaeon]